MSQLWRWSLVFLCTTAIASSLAVYLTLSPVLQAQAERSGLSASSQGQDGSVIESAVAASVQLFADRDGGARRAGSGVVVAVDGNGTALILTAAHLIEPMVKQTVSVSDPGGAGNIPARILHSDADSDVAILEADGLNRPPVAWHGAGRLGDDVWVVSYPWGRHRTLVSGVVSQVEEMRRDDPRRVPETAATSIEGPGAPDRRRRQLRYQRRGRVRPAHRVASRDRSRLSDRQAVVSGWWRRKPERTDCRRNDGYPDISDSLRPGGRAAHRSARGAAPGGSAPWRDVF